MAITIISSPNINMSGYNPIKWVIDSDNKNTPGFRYIVEVYDVGTSNKLIEIDVAPDPTDNGYGKFDISRIVRNKIDKYLDLTNFNIQNATDTFYKYDIKFGESLSYEWEYDDYIISNGNTALTTDTIYGASFSNTTHEFNVGDQVFVEMNLVYGDCRDVINGFFTIINVVSNKTVEINLGFPCSGPASPGIISFANKRKLRTYDLTRENGRLVLNTAMSLKEYSDTSGSLSEYLISAPSTTKKFLTNVPNGYKVSLNQHMWINQFINTGGTTNSVDIRVENSNGDIFNIPNSGNFIVKTNGIGPANFGTYSVVSGSAPIIKGDTEWYEINITNDGGDSVSEKKRFVIDRRCVINDIEVLFMDRKGSFMSYYFPLRKFENITTNKKVYNNYIDGIETYSDGVKVYNSEIEKKITLNSNYMTDEMSLYFEELLSSPYTYIRYEGDWYSCKVMDGSFETERFINKRLIKKTIDVSFDINTSINI
jgi:hypothetical protein